MSILLKDKIKQDAGFQYVIDSLELMSGVARTQLLGTVYSTDVAFLDDECSRMGRICQVLVGTGMPQRQESTECQTFTVGQFPASHPFTALRHQLMQLHELSTTFANLSHETTLGEVELFEIKHLAFLNGKARNAVSSLGWDDMIDLPSLDEVFSLLDPDHTGVPSFYIYDSYHSELPELRRQMAMTDPSDERFAELFKRQNIIQYAVEKQLTAALAPYCQSLVKSLRQLAYTDILIAKSELALKWGLCRPQLCEGASPMAYTHIFNPRMRQTYLQRGMRYQSVDVRFEKCVTLVTGANMAGKTVLLKTVATAQLMVQFGFFAPAEKACVSLVDDVVPCIGDEQDEMGGLSSFAAEMMRISDALSRARSERLLIVVDEPARTTNPEEGQALVAALVAQLQKTDSHSLITTHYAVTTTGCCRLRVRGFVEPEGVQVTVGNISQFMDYSLHEDSATEVPHEALHIASLLGCDEALVQDARKMLDKESL